MTDEPREDMDMPAEVDFSKGVRGRHYIPAGAKVLVPASIELSALRRDIEINEALK